MCDSGRYSTTITAQCAFALTRSLANNNIINSGTEMSGVIALAAALKDSQISTLK